MQCLLIDLGQAIEQSLWTATMAVVGVCLGVAAGRLDGGMFWVVAAGAASFAGACLDKAGNRGTKSFTLSYDATGPATTATADRSPDSSGWVSCR